MQKLVDTLARYFEGFTRPRRIKIWALPEDKDQQVALTVTVMIQQVISGAWDPEM